MARARPTPKPAPRLAELDPTMGAPGGPPRSDAPAAAGRGGRARFEQLAESIAYQQLRGQGGGHHLGSLPGAVPGPVRSIRPRCWRRRSSRPARRRPVGREGGGHRRSGPPRGRRHPRPRAGRAAERRRDHRRSWCRSGGSDPGRRTCSCCSRCNASTCGPRVTTACAPATASPTGWPSHRRPGARRGSASASGPTAAWPRGTAGGRLDVARQRRASSGIRRDRPCHRIVKSSSTSARGLRARFDPDQGGPLEEADHAAGRDPGLGACRPSPRASSSKRCRRARRTSGWSVAAVVPISRQLADVLRREAQVAARRADRSRSGVGRVGIDGQVELVVELGGGCARTPPRPGRPCRRSSCRRAPATRRRRRPAPRR